MSKPFIHFFLPRKKERTKNPLKLSQQNRFETKHFMNRYYHEMLPSITYDIIPFQDWYKNGWKSFCKSCCLSLEICCFCIIWIEFTRIENNMRMTLCVATHHDGRKKKCLCMHERKKNGKNLFKLPEDSSDSGIKRYKKVKEKKC